jgi:hypothetical protein
MTKEKTYDTPSDVTATDGIVSVKGPDAVDVELTAEAADEPSDRLLEASLKARGQIIAEESSTKR